MKIQLLSDLHVEFGGYSYPESEADIIVLAGDIHLKDKGVKWALDHVQDKPVIYILGNHEFYRETYPKLIEELKETAKGSNLHVLENESVRIDGVNFLGCTLWTDFNLYGDAKLAGFECQQVMNDYRLIRRMPDYSKIQTKDTAALHKESLCWLSNELKMLEGQKNIVVTHHGPSIKSVPERYLNDTTSAAFVSNLEEFISSHDINCWMHGHLHNSSDYFVGNCRVLCNPKGYPGEENFEYEPEFSYEISE